MWSAASRWRVSGRPSWQPSCTASFRGRFLPCFFRTKMETPDFSIEFFPPKTPEGAEKLRIARAKLADLNPKYFSVTFGAGGSTQQGTLATVREIQAAGHEAAPHLSCIGATRDSIRD